MHVEAVRTDGAPSRTGLVRHYMRIECPQCWTAYHLHHDGLEMKLLRGYFLRANWQISGEYPNHRQVIVMEPSSAVVREKPSQATTAPIRCCELSGVGWSERRCLRNTG
jgi:hypothetical protein